jgi:hypothetical protein
MIFPLAQLGKIFSKDSISFQKKAFEKIMSKSREKE